MVTKATTKNQQNILNKLEGKPPVGGGNEPKKKTAPKGPRRYMADPGIELVGEPPFPFETKDRKQWARIEKSRSFKRGRIWVEMRTEEERDAADDALRHVSVPKLRKILIALGHRRVTQYRRYELIDLLSKEGFGV